VTGAFLILLSGANLATPLYAVYRERFGFSSAVLTLVFATCAPVLAPSLLLFGQLSDSVGRRVVLLGGLAVAIAGLVLFALARGTAWLFAARAAQGLAVGAVSGTATAALVEFDPSGDEQRPPLLAGLAQAGGSAGGALAAGAVAQWAPLPRVLPFLAGIAATAVAGLAIAAARARPPGGRWHVQRPGVPREIRVRFARVSVTGAAVWSVAALFLSVVPTYSGKLLHTRNLALLAALAALLLLASCVAQTAAHRGLAPLVPKPSASVSSLPVCSRSSSPSRSSRFRSSRPPRCSLAWATATRSSAPRRSSTQSRRKSAAARSPRRSRRASTSALRSP
jgi:MFS family permease